MRTKRRAARARGFRWRYFEWGLSWTSEESAPNAAPLEPLVLTLPPRAAEVPYGHR
jgi:hypothetical protein